MIRLDAATVLLQWAVGGLLFLWVTTRAREVGIGYGWLVRGTYILMALGCRSPWVCGSTPCRFGRRRSLAVAGAATVALVVSVQRRKAGVAGQRALAERRSARVAAMTGIDRQAEAADPTVAEFPPALDLVAPLLGLPGLVAAGVGRRRPRAAVGAAGAGRAPPSWARSPTACCSATGTWCSRAWPAGPCWRWCAGPPSCGPSRWSLLLWPVGMVSVLNGTIDDGYGGTFGWFWVACAVTTIVLLAVTRAALRERYYSAVMAATGLLYLAILTAFGTDLVARAVLAS